MSGPISPSQVTEAKERDIPEEVFDVVNQLIIEKWNGFSATLLQHDIVTRLEDIDGFPSHEIYPKGWLNFEDVYRRAGWKVRYDKPAYNETYPGLFEFSKD